MIKWLGRNLGTFFLAFGLALAVWVSAVTASDPDETRTYPTQVPISIIGQDPGLVITGDYPRQVSLVLRAPQSIWRKLTADTDLVRAEVDLSNVSAGSHAVPVQIQVGVQPVRVISASVSTLDLTLETLVVRTLPIHINLFGSPALGYQVQPLKLSENQVVVSGPKSLMDQVKSVTGSLDVTDIRQDLAGTVNLQAVDARDQEVSGVSLAPPQVQVTVPLVQQGGYRDLAVKVVVTGRVTNGYRLTSILVTPAVVTVYSSDSSLVDSLPGYVETSELNLNDVSADIETRLTLNLPAGVSLVGAQDVLVQVGIAPIEGSLILSGRPVGVVGLASGLKASVSPLIVDLYLSGPLPLLDALNASQVLVSVDVTGLGPGTYYLVPNVTLLVTGLRVETIVPGTVQVILR